MTTTKADKVAATVPFAMHNLADHITTHALPGPVDIDFPGTMVGDNEAPAVRIILDQRNVTRWLAHLDGTYETKVTQHLGGVWHDATGTANCVRVRLSWFVVADLVDHQPCAGDDGTCGQTICYCPAQRLGPCQGTVEIGCTHGWDLCYVHRHECSECVDDARQTAAEGWTAR